MSTDTKVKRAILGFLIGVGSAILYYSFSRDIRNIDAIFFIARTQILLVGFCGAAFVYVLPSKLEEWTGDEKPEARE